MQWEAFLEFPYLSKDRSPKRNSIIMNSFQRVSLTRRDWIFSQERRLELDSTSRQTLPDLSYIPFVLRVPFTFPKIIYCLPRSLHLPPHFLLRLYLWTNFATFTKRFSGCKPQFPLDEDKILIRKEGDIVEFPERAKGREKEKWNNKLSSHEHTYNVTKEIYRITNVAYTGI